MLPKTLAALFLFCTGAYATARTAPPSGAVVVRGSGTRPGSSALSRLQSILYRPTLRANHLRLPGSSVHQRRHDHAVNQVRLTFGLSQGTAGAGELSATLRIDKAFFKLYNVDVVNSALAVAGYGSNLGFYAVGFYGYQDTLRAEKGVQFYGLCYIEGTIGHAFFHRNTIASVDGGAITADGPDTADLSLYVINLSTLTTSTAATANLTGKVFLGRPWSAAAQLVQFSLIRFRYSSLFHRELTMVLEWCTYRPTWARTSTQGWEPWSTAEPNTSGVLFAEFGSTGPGAAGTRASFSKKLPRSRIRHRRRPGEIRGRKFRGHVQSAAAVIRYRLQSILNLIGLPLTNSMAQQFITSPKEKHLPPSPKMPYAFAATRPVNPPGAEPVLTEEQLWKGLEYKARNPAPFIPFISASKTTFEEGNKVGVQLLIQHSPDTNRFWLGTGSSCAEVTLANPDHSILTESIETHAPTIVYFEMKETGLRVTNTISYGPADELLLTYSFANGRPTALERNGVNELTIGERALYENDDSPLAMAMVRPFSRTVKKRYVVLTRTEGGQGRASGVAESYSKRSNVD
ncbi:hypothetical protein B0H14DRAFT_2602062 [Mycena olivaceomarginata]|nr:hypothetical protein B0H14DRAFT_2602062 [Mycena olivaceomarginata]